MNQKMKNVSCTSLGMDCKEILFSPESHFLVFWNIILLFVLVVNVFYASVKITMDFINLP